MSLIETETHWLRTTILPKILESGRLLDTYSASKADTFRVGDIDVDVIGPKEAFMLTLCYRTTIRFEYDGKQFERKMVVKKTPRIQPEMYKDIQFSYLFGNEIEFYTKILPQIEKVSGEKLAAPKYYYSELNPLSAMVILSDFAEDGWSITKDRVGLSLDHVRVAVKYLGKFHGFAYAIKHKNPDQFENMTKNLRESRFSNEIMHPDFLLKLKTSVKRAVQAVATYQPQVGEDFVQNFGLLISDYTKFGRQRVAPREPLATLCHGDYVRNNVAYKYDGKEEPQEIMMFDYQTLRVSSPMIDLSVFLAISVYADVRYTYFDSIFDDYCSALYDSYRKHAKDEVPEFLNRTELLKEYIRFLPYSVSITAYFLFSLVEPSGLSSEEMINCQVTDEEIIESTMKSGGEIVDREIAHQLREMFELSRTYNVPIDEAMHNI
ncbi:uncharacterized protein JhI-26 [Drosophila pseudoobscura]|uniref:Uncharacterized protein JhI-26 n=1 Tax=Drosophila pseudoobscura pseudoobscura TaxID=46245 RepID=A0A6I8V4C1_DROPS|nr:uncharacterized protein LOC6898252 [Drosophila pseudoobscura]